MLNYIWPIALIVLSNVIYQICTKNIPNNANPFASLTVSYTIATVLSTIIFLITNKQDSIIKEFSKLNWASLLLGFALIGLEAGFIYAYRSGWQISITAIVQSSFVAIFLIFIGFFLYKEPLTWNKIIGIVICLIGLFFINKK